MAKLKCRCGHKFAETLADLQQQGITRLKCPACGLGSTIPLATKLELNASTADEMQSQSESAEPSDNDFFANFDSPHEVDEPASAIEVETLRDADATVRQNVDSVAAESITAKSVTTPDSKSSSVFVLNPWEKEYVWFLFWLFVTIGVIVASYPHTNPLSDFSTYSPRGRFRDDNAVGATANSIELLVHQVKWMTQNQPTPTNLLVTNLLLLGILFLLWKLYRTKSSQRTEAPPAK